MKRIRLDAGQLSPRGAVMALVLWTFLQGSPAIAEAHVAVEYGLSTVWDYGEWSYFVTSLPEETTLLDAGAFDTDWGLVWRRTGQKFNVWSGPEDGAEPTCRFFGFNDHFYTPYLAECEALKASADWTFEGIVFYLKLPDENGECPVGTSILYRLFNMQGTFNHRLLTSLAEVNWMLVTGWVFEGDARTMAFACVPSTN